MYAETRRWIPGVIVTVLCISTADARQILRVPGVYPTIQAAIDDAGEGDMVLVAPGTYREAVKMKAGVDLIGNGPAWTILTAQRTNAVVSGADHCRLDGFTITGHIHEDIDGVYCQDVNDFTISNNVIKNCTWSGVNLVRSAAVLRNNVIFGNRCAGVFLSYPAAEPPVIINNTIWDNANEADINVWHGARAFIQNNILQDIDCDEESQADVHFNDIANQPAEGDNIQADPLFVDPNAGDFHLLSQTGRWDPVGAVWIEDYATSPCIDAGDPASPVGHEPAPNGGRINLGAYGGTAEASKSPFDK
jgi:parallel beta-helix repeat protein